MDSKNLSYSTKQDQYYIDFEVMKKIIGKNRGEFSKLEIIEEVKKNYNENTDDIMDYYVYLIKKRKYTLKIKIKNKIKNKIRELF